VIYGKKYTNMHKVVFTKTLGKSEWGNTVLAKADCLRQFFRVHQKNENENRASIGANGARTLMALVGEPLKMQNLKAVG
jgi:hypothetical protein